VCEVGPIDATNQGIHQLDAVIVGRVVAGRDHDSNGGIALLRSRTRNHADGVNHMVQARIPIVSIEISAISTVVVAVVGRDGSAEEDVRFHAELQRGTSSQSSTQQHRRCRYIPLLCRTRISCRLE